MASKSYLQGNFRPINPHKYGGNPNNIIYRSSWEMKVMTWLDLNENITRWQSEEFFIPYLDPKSNKMRRYFPDFKVETVDRRTIIIEVKPKKKLDPPERGKKSQKTFLGEMYEYAMNQSKFLAASNYCLDRGYEFKILTEEDIIVL